MFRKPVNRKAEIAISVFKEFLKSPIYCQEAKAAIMAAILKLEVEPEEGIELYMAKYISGGITTALALHQYKYGTSASDVPVVSTDPHNEFFNAPYYSEPLETVTQGIPNIGNNLDLNKIILETGKKILANQISFDQKKLTYLFPDLTEHFAVIENRRRLGNASDAKMPSITKQVYNRSLEAIKARISEIFTPYFDNNKFHIFSYGPHHKTRAKQVLTSIEAAIDVETILLILENQQNVMQGVSGIEIPLQLKNSVSLDPRWTTAAAIKNKAKSINQSGYFDILVKSIQFIETCETKKENLYEQVLRPTS